MKRALLILALLLANLSSFAQCAMCKAVAQSGQNSVSGGLNDAIIYLMIVPYLLLFIFFRKRIIRGLKELRGLWVKPKA